MNGFKPLGDLKSWHIYGIVAFAVIGMIAIAIWAINGIIWIINHITITP